MTQLTYRLGGFLLAVSLALFVAGCDGVTGLQSENTSSPATSSTQKATQPQVSGADFECPANPDEVVDTKDDLDEAVENADPGTVIAINGTIELSRSVNIPIEKGGLTVTCATPGSGVDLVENPDPPSEEEYIQNLFTINAPNFTLHDLKIDARRVDGESNNTWARAAIFAGDNDGSEQGLPRDARKVEIRDNLILIDVTGERSTTGGYGVRLIGPEQASIVGNTIRAEGKSAAGIFISPNGNAKDRFDDVGEVPRPDGAEIRGNTVSTQTPSVRPDPKGRGPRLGAIDVSAGNQVEIAENTVRGPWKHGLSFSDLDDGRIAGNVISGPEIKGVHFKAGPGGIIRDATIKRNRIEEPGDEGFFVRKACGNLFQGNALVRTKNAGTFTKRTGDNQYRGNPRGIIDNGRFDCDGDGKNDPNDIKGSPSR